LEGKEGVLEFIHQRGCIQFDPINVVGRNHELVLQSRVRNFRPHQLEELLYRDRKLVDGWDKMASIFLTTDWPYFSRHRAHMREKYRIPSHPPMELVPLILKVIRDKGPQSSTQMRKVDEVSRLPGETKKLVRSSLDLLYATGELMIHHREGNQKVYDLSERLLPADLLFAQDPNLTTESYRDWHMMRRVGGIGLANPGAGEHWGGLLGMKRNERQATLARLVKKDKMVPVVVEGVPDRIFFLRSADISILEKLQSEEKLIPRAAVIAPLDNLIWDRSLMNWIFDFDYVWEVYKPKAKRKFGYYVLPVLYGDTFVARFDPSFEKEKGKLIIQNWWWEEGITMNPDMEAALISCFRDFMRYLGATQIQLHSPVKRDKSLHWLQAVQ
jgi:hypothetical protein